MEPLLPRLDEKTDLGSLDREELSQLCEELREEIITAVSRNGGHLGASLGVVELTVALHTVFNTPVDKIIWDVGHQAYGHKLLTGRRERFHTLRCRGGISGFPKRSESSHDAFGVGHASTAISAALGFAAARDIQGGDHAVVAVVGDGALTGGLSFEGMNNVGSLNTDLIVVLNDNKMSISPNVGALSRYLTRITSGRHYNRLERWIWSGLGRAPYGGKAQVLAQRFKTGLKHLLVPTIYFEQLGFKYFGPLDGHDLPLLQQTLRAVRDLGGPILVHVLTRKGKGYRFAEQDSPRYHGVGSFDKGEGIKVVQPRVPSYTDVFGETLARFAQEDPRICGITAAMPEGTGLSLMKERVPDRFFDVGIAEGHAVTFAAGLACEGQRPVVALYSTFLQRAYDHLVHDVALQNLPVVFAVDRGGLVGEDGPTHHGAFDLSYLRTVPNLVLMAPSDEHELRRMLLTALRREDGPSALRYPRGAGVGVDLDCAIEPLEIGRARRLRHGDELCLLAIGSMVYPCLDAAERLERSGISAAVVDLRFAKPLDEKMLALVWGSHRLLVTVEENSLIGGVGAAILEWAADTGRSREASVLRIGIPDDFQEHAKRSELLESLGLTGEGIARRVLQEMEREDPKRSARSAS